MKLAVVGATGMVGTVMLDVLKERKFQYDELLLVASKKSVGKLIDYCGEKYSLIDVEMAIEKKPDIAIFSAGGDTSLKWAPKFAEIGTIVIDNSSAWRMDPSKKLIIPEINGDLISKEDKIIANPNCSTIQMLVALQPIYEVAGIKRINVKYVGADNNTYQAAFSVQLRNTINTASSGESLDDIKTSAPQAFASQNRMITASDYNGLLLTTTDSVKKVKAVNRTHSGFSRYVDMKDPTGAYSNLRLFATDGILTKSEHTKETIISDVSAAVVFDKHIRKAVSDDEMINLYYDKFLNTFTTLKTTYTQNDFLWTQSIQYPLQYHSLQYDADCDMW